MYEHNCLVLVGSVFTGDYCNCTLYCSYICGLFAKEVRRNKVLEVKKLKDFMEERDIQEGEQFAMLPLTNWYMFDDCFGQ